LHTFFPIAIAVGERPSVGPDAIQHKKLSDRCEPLPYREVVRGAGVRGFAPLGGSSVIPEPQAAIVMGGRVQGWNT
jgi:hypothetical protein